VSSTRRPANFLWQLVVPKLKSGKVNDWENLGMLSSPTIEGNRVYLVTSRCEVICLDINGMANGNQGMQDEAKYVVKDTGKAPAKPGLKDADIIWVYDMMDELGVFPHNASNSSPIIVGDLVLRLHLQRPGLDARQHSLPAVPELHRAQQEHRRVRGEDDAGIGPKIFPRPVGVPVGRKR
jgi:hypothetical protein